MSEVTAYFDLDGTLLDDSSDKALHFDSFFLKRIFLFYNSCSLSSHPMGILTQW